MEMSYGLNDLLNIPARYGKFDVIGYLFYTDRLENDLAADTQIYWGGGGGVQYCSCIDWLGGLVSTRVIRARAGANNQYQSTFTSSPFPASAARG
jgi:hypothetical protein